MDCISVNLNQAEYGTEKKTAKKRTRRIQLQGMVIDIKKS